MKKFININGNPIDLSTPLVMGILNVTPDSFYPGSRKQTEREIAERARQILEEGGTLIDLGGQSTAPLAPMHTAQEERKRVEPALCIIRREFPDATISIDTFYSEVARWAVEKYGVNMINDISGGQIDPDMFETVARLNVPYILMHMRGTPQTMQQLTDYDDLIPDILYYFSEKIAQLNELGVNDVIVDPGFGFSKTLEQNYRLMAYLKYFDTFELPILVGVSRKSMIYRLLGCTSQESLNGTSVLNTVSLLSGADILRVHDVREAVECVRIVREIKHWLDPEE